MCNVADVMLSTADSTHNATDSMQVTADILPKTYFFQRGIIHFFSKCTKGGNKH